MSRMKPPSAATETAAVPRETRYVGDDAMVVIMPRHRAPGIRAFGPLRAGVEYVVSPAEAERLVHAKGFEYAPAPTVAPSATDPSIED